MRIVQLWLFSLVLLIAACAGRRDRRALEESLRQEYGAGTAVAVRPDGDGRHLQILLESPAWDSLPDPQIPYQALEVARKAWARYRRPEDLLELTVRFVRFLPEDRSAWCYARSTGFRRADPANPRSLDLAITRVDYPTPVCERAPGLAPPVGCASCVPVQPGSPQKAPEPTGGHSARSSSSPARGTDFRSSPAAGILP